MERGKDGGEIDRFFTACAECVRQLPKMKRQRLGFAERACALAKQNAVKEAVAQLSYGARSANGIGRQDRSIAKRKKAAKRAAKAAADDFFILPSSEIFNCHYFTSQL